MTTPVSPLYAALSATARACILYALVAARGHRRAAARALGIPERTLHTLLNPREGLWSPQGRLPLFAEGELAALAAEHAWPDRCAVARERRAERSS